MIAQNEVKNYVPKEVTQHRKFLQNYSNYDGRGIVIAIIDSGLDVSLDGMQKTTIGSPKVIDCMDFTGAGNVDTSVIKEFNNNYRNNIIGISGRLLNIPSTWINPSGKWHLGIKSIYELCSEEALKNIIKIRTELIEKQNSKLKYSFKMKNFENENYNAAVKYLKCAKDLSKDSLVADCIVWFNGSKWQACIDTSFIGELSSSKILSNFCDQQDYGTILDQITYCVKIHNNGNLLEIFTSYSNHGTTVAHVAAGNYPKEPEKNGVAPGAQIILMNVLDPRNGKFCNFKAIKNALHKCIEMKVDIVNLSVSLEDEHEEVINEMTEKYGIIVTKAAGNCGPVYSSLYETDVKIKNIFIIGSVYTIKDDFKKDDAIIPVYSSRGPGINGSRGISFVAPGDAITAVPRYSSIKHEILYGTSFSAPNAAGAIACLLSALKDNDIKYSVSSIKTALEKTAFLPKNGDVLGFGHGIIQIYDAFKFLKKFNLAIVQNYSNRKRKLKIISDKSIKNGIFVKLNNENDAIKDGYEIKLLNDTEFGSCSPPKRIKLQSTTKSKNANFVLHSKITKNYSFKIAIQKHKLKFGALNYTEIHGILFSKIPYFQQLFHLPITVISPSNVTKEEGYCIKENQLKLSPNIPYRFFILPPKEICQCIVTVAVETRASLYLQYSIENISVSSTTGKWLEFNETTKVLTFDIKIYGNKIHEIAIFPDIDEPINCDIEIQFYGIKVIKNSLENKKVVDQNVITFYNNLQNLHATLIMEFENISFKLSPIQFNFETNKSQYDICENECLKLTYNFTLPKKSKCLFKMNLEKIFKMFRVQVFTESKKYVYGYVTDLKEPFTFLPGTYSIFAYILHTYTSDEYSLLSLDSVPQLTVTISFDDPIKPNIYNSPLKTKESIYFSKEMMEFTKNEHRIYFNKINIEQILPSFTLSSINVTLQGSLNFNIKQNVELKIPFCHEYSWNVIKNAGNEEKKHVFDSCKLKYGIPDAQEISKQLISILDGNNFDNLFQKLETFLQNSKRLDKNANLKLKKSEKKEKDLNIPLVFKGIKLCKFTKPIFNSRYISTKYANIASKKHSKNSTNFNSNLFTNISKICNIFHDHFHYNDDEIKNDLLRIKEALVFRHFGIALLNLNNISIKYQTNPLFKIIDFAIIEILKYLEWEHLIEVHQNSMLDRHRKSYRLL